MYRKELVLNHQQGLLCHKIQTKLNQIRRP